MRVWHMAKGLLDGATPDEQRGVWFAIAQMNIRLRRWKDAEDALGRGRASDDQEG